MKETICKVFAHFLYRAIKVLYKRDERIKSELDSLGDCAFALQFSMDKETCVVIEKTQNGIKKRKKTQKNDNIIIFKTLPLAFKVMTGQKGLSQSYCEHDFILKGSIVETMAFVRIVEIAMTHLLPKCMLKKILREVPERKISLVKTYLLAIFGA